MHNIERSAFHKGEHVGYAVGTVWKIVKGGEGYRATAREHYPDSKYPRTLTARTLGDLSVKLDGLYSENPAPRIGTARPRRVSQVTKKPPTKRLIKRRVSNVKKGYFPNPVNDPAKGALELAIVQAIKAAQIPAKMSNKTENLLIAQARISFAQGMIQAAEIMGIFTRAETKMFLTQLKPDGVIGK